MNRENAKALLPVITAFAEGKTVQIRDITGKWSAHESYAFGGQPSNYRIKPEPRKVFVRLYDDGSCNAYTQKGLDRYVSAPGQKEYVEFVEVIK